MAAPTRPPFDAPEHDWTTQAAETVESVVLSVKEKTTILTTIARAIVYGLVIAAVVAFSLVAIVIGVIRIADVYLLGWAGQADGQRRLWVAYLALGIFFSLVGFFLWSKRRAKEA